MADRGVIEFAAGDAECRRSRRRAQLRRRRGARLAAVRFRRDPGVADALPVMIAFCDAELRYRFVNRALADWFERPRSDILGRTMREVLGEQAYRDARADARRRRWPASGSGSRPISDHPTPRTARGPGRLYPADRRRRARRRADHAGPGHHRAARRRARAQGKRGALPPHRRFRAGADVGDAARPQPRLRQRRLCRIDRGQPRRGAAARLGERGSIPTTMADASPKAGGRGERQAVHGRGALLARTMANSAGCARCRSRGRDADGRADRASSASRPTSPDQGSRARAAPAGRGAHRGIERKRGAGSARSSTR